MIVAVIMLSGCATNKITLSTEETGTNGVRIVRTTRSLTFALWPATSDIKNQRVTSLKGHGIGTTELHQETGGTNVTEALKVIDSIIGKIKP